MRLWRLGDEGLISLSNLQTDEPSTWVSMLAVGQLLDGQAVAVTGRFDGMVQLWRLGDDRLIPVGPPQSGHGDSDVRAVAVGQLRGRPVAVTGGEDGTVALLHLGHHGLASVAIARIPIDSPVVSVTILLTGTVLVWCRDGALTAEMRNP